MRKILSFLLVILTGLAGYALLGAFVLSRPISYGSIEPMIQAKLAYGRKVGSPKLIVLAGSNARTSHRCALLEARLGWPCVNAGNTAGLGLSYVFDRFEAIMAPGDVVYLPLEYQQYTVSRAAALTGPDAAILYRFDKRELLKRGPEGVVRAIFMVDLRYIVDSLIEMQLNSIGVKARFDAKAFDAQGDELGLTHKRGLAYDAYIQASRWRPPTAAEFRNAHGAKDEVGEFLDWCHGHGVRVIGGLPVAFDDRPIPDDLIAAMADFYRSHGAEFLVMDNRSQYPRSEFYDSPFHLEEEWALLHTERLAKALAAQLPPRTAPPKQISVVR